jgi:hypothetical protein
MREISWLAEELLASQEELCSVMLVKAGVACCQSADTIGSTQHLLVTQGLGERSGSSVDRMARPSSASQGLAELNVNAVFRRSLNGDSLALPRVCRQKAVQLLSRSLCPQPCRPLLDALQCTATLQDSADSSKQTVLP